MTNALAVKYPTEPLSGHATLCGDNKIDLITTTDKISIRIRELAFNYISLYGLRRITMQDVAIACRISRAALYQRFPSKEALFIAIREYVLHQACARLESEWAPELTIGKNLAACLISRDLFLFEMINSSPHGRDLIYSGNAIDIGVDKFLINYSANFLLQKMSTYQNVQFGPFDGADKMCQFASRASFAVMLSTREKRNLIADIEAICLCIELITIV